MTEQWKHAWGFSRYMVSSEGRVRSRENGLYITRAVGKDGTCTVVLITNDGVKLVKTVHRLIADTFLYDPEGYSQVYHADGNKSNNRVDNLRRKSAVDETERTAIISQFRPLDDDERQAIVSDFTPADPRRKGFRGMPSDRSLLNAFPNKPAPKRVRCLETGAVYRSQSACARALGVSQSGISAVLRGRSHMAGGYTFEYVEGEIDND